MQVLTTTEEVSTKPGSGWAGILSPSLPDIYFAVVILWLFLGGGGKLLLSDGDTGWHIRTGDYILANHAVPRQDLFTFTKPNEPWFAWEWLADVFFSWLHTGWGLKAVAMAVGVVLCAATALVF